MESLRRVLIQTQVHEMGAEHPYYKSAQFAHVEEDEEDERRLACQIAGI